MGSLLSEPYHDVYNACVSNDSKTALKLIYKYNINNNIICDICDENFHLINRNKNIIDDNNKNIIYSKKNVKLNNLEVIKHLSFVDEHDNTALIWACQNKMTDVALELIKTGFSKPEHINNNHKTALIIACENNMTDVALELIKIDNFRQEYYNCHGNTLLILTCENKMTDVALELIKTGYSKPEYHDYKALKCAYKNKMTNVFKELMDIMMIESILTIEDLDMKE